MDEVPENERHVPIQKRRGFACRWCREPMEPGSKEAKQKCPERAQREEKMHSHATFETLAQIKHKQEAQIKRERSRGTRKKAHAHK